MDTLPIFCYRLRPKA